MADKVPTSPLALICGDDDFAVKQRARQIFDAWSAAAPDEDREIIDAQAGNSTEALQSIGRLREALQTLPFFGGGKLVWWRQCSFLGDDRTAASHAVTEAVSELAQELKSFRWEKVRLLISAAKVDRRRTFYKTLDDAGHVEIFSAWSLESKTWQAEAENLAAQVLQSRRISIQDEALTELIESVGPNRPQLYQELEKLELYSGSQNPVTVDTVRAVVTRNKQARAFALGDALGDRNLGLLLKTLDQELWELRSDRQRSEIGILYGLISKVRMMILAKALQQQNLLKSTRSFAAFKSQLEQLPAGALPQDDRYNPKGLSAYPLFRAMEQAANYSAPELVRAMDLLLQCNLRLISSSLEGALLLQQTLIQIVQRQSGSGEPHP